MMISYASLMADRHTRPCDACGERARCAPDARFGGLLCASCSINISRAARKIATGGRQDFTSCDPKPAPVRQRRGVTQFASTKPATCDVSIVRELERAYHAFRRFPVAETRSKLIDAVAARCVEVKV